MIYQSYLHLSHRYIELGFVCGITVKMIGYLLPEGGCFHLQLYILESGFDACVMCFSYVCSIKMLHDDISRGLKLRITFFEFSMHKMKEEKFVVLIVKVTLLSLN